MSGHNLTSPASGKPPSSLSRMASGVGGNAGVGSLLSKLEQMELDYVQRGDLSRHTDSGAGIFQSARSGPRESFLATWSGASASFRRRRGNLR